MRYAKPSFCRIWLLAGLVLLLAGPAWSSELKERRLSLHFDNLPLNDALQQLQSEYDLHFVYSDDLVKRIKVNCHHDNLPLSRALEILFAGSGIDYRIVNSRQIVLIKSPRRPIRKFDVRGYIYDGENGEPLPYANSYITGTNMGTVSNVDGYFVLVNVPEGPHELTIEYLGYAPARIPLTPRSPSPALRIELQPNLIPGSDVDVTEQASEVMQLSRESGEVRFSPKLLPLLPSVGDEDIFRSLQLLPGVRSAGDGSSGLHIRGGRPDQNLVLFDGMTIYHVDHFFGFLSAFNSSAVKDVRIFRGGFPAKYGDRTSGVIELTGKSGSQDHLDVGLGVNLLSSRAYASVPLKGRGAWLFSARRSYSDFLQSKAYNNIVNLFFKEESDAVSTYSDAGQLVQLQPSVYFYDINSKLTLNPSRRDVLSLSFYGGRDHLDILQELNLNPSPADTNIALNINETVKWGNIGISGKWSRIWSSRFYSNLNIARSWYNSQYREDLDIASVDGTPLSYQFFEDNRVRNTRITLDNEWQLSHNGKLEFGAAWTDANIRYQYVQGDTATILNEDRQSIQGALYGQGKIAVSSRLDFTAGMRSTYYALLQKFYLEPRVSFVYSLSGAWNLKGAWGHYHQFLKNIITEDLLQRRQGFWLLANRQLPPEFAEHFIAGIGYETPDYRFDLEGYVKQIRGLTQYSFRFTGDYAQFDTRELFLEGSGSARGLEIFAQKKRGKFSGWASYAVSRSEHRFPGINTNRYYPANNDQTHDLKLVGQYALGRWHFSATWMYASGRPYNAPETQYFITLLDGTVQRHFYLGDRNGDRLPDYHRLDISAAVHLKSRRANWEFGVSIFNLYDHENVWYRKYNLFNDPVSARDVTMLGVTPNLFFKVNLK